MIGFYNYTVILTYLSLVSSALGIYFASGIGESGSHPEYAIVCLMLSGLFDMFDGKVARTRKRTDEEKKFGIQIDSLCDLVCFGVLPSVIGYSIGMNSWADMFVLILFTLCAVIRLAYFNVMEEARQKVTKENRKEYEGLLLQVLHSYFRFFTASKRKSDMIPFQSFTEFFYLLLQSHLLHVSKLKSLI